MIKVIICWSNPIFTDQYCSNLIFTYQNAIMFIKLKFVHDFGENSIFVLTISCLLHNKSYNFCLFLLGFLVS